MNRKSEQFHRPAGAGFTLIELMVSIALVLILILGINQVFKIASDTVNVGQAMSGAAREDRGIQGTLYPDMQNAVVSGAPFFIIRSHVQPAFRTRADELADRDANPYTADIDGNNKEGENIPGEVTPPLTYNARNHRLDKLMFFANYRYRRQTGSNGRFMDDLSSNEAYVCYGHLSQPNNRTANLYAGGNASKVVNYQPGQADNGPYNATGPDRNDNNKYATQWILGRNVVLLKPTPPFAGASKQEFFFRAATAKGYSPLDENSASSDGGKWDLQSSRYDVAATSIDAFRNIILDPKNAGPIPWWEMISGFRFQGFPYPTRPLTADVMARTVPIFVPGCTQFIVEYAGDFLKQDPFNGDIVGSAFDAGGQGDGVIDFVAVPLPGAAAGAPGARRTRWYGAPRNVDTGDDKFGKPVILGAGQDRAIKDVVPLRDLLMAKGIPIPPDFFEREIDKRLPNNKDYGTIAAPTGAPAARGAGFVSPVMGTPGPLPAGNEYVAAWSPTQLSKGSSLRPRMIRITIVVDDPAGRMTDGQTYEYVFTLP